MAVGIESLDTVLENGLVTSSILCIVLNQILPEDGERSGFVTFVTGLFGRMREKVEEWRREWREQREEYEIV